MGTLLLVLGAGLFFALVVFFICEEKSLKDADFSDMKGLCTTELNPKECMGKFDTVKYMVIYVIALLIFDLIIANLVFLPNNFGLTEILLFTFVPSLVGSWVILLVKWTYQPVIKLISSFMYGGGYMGAAIVAFSITYLLLA
jgi:hypothetical protein